MKGIVAVLGAGTMGRGIARVAAESGFEVRLADLGEEILAAALADIERGQKKGVEKGKLDAAIATAARSRLTTTTVPRDAVDGADWVIEAVPEKPDIKAATYGAVGSALGETTILGSNTSSLPISRLAANVPAAERFIGIHFFNPVPIMRLVEVVRGNATSEETVERTVAFARDLGKTPIVVRDSPGFATSRLGVLLGLEAIRMVEEGVASAEDIDTAMELGYRHPMGPLRLTDLVGLDVRLGIAEALHRELGSEAFRPPALLRRLVEEGRLGQKSGHGFYPWPQTSA